MIPFDAKGRPRRYINGHHTRTLVWHRKRPYPPESTTTGRKASAETRERLRASHIGKVPANKGVKTGRPSWNRGKKMPPVSLETRRKISAANKGARSYLWRGGIDNGGRLPRTRTPEWKYLRDQAYRRDGWQCVICQKRQCILNCHHIVPVVFGGADELGNLATLCVSCHKRQENLYGTEKYFWPAHQKVAEATHA